MLPIGIDLDRAHRQHQRSRLPPLAAIGDAVLHKSFAAVSEGRRVEFNIPHRPDDARNGQRAVDQRLADRGASGCPMQSSAKTQHWSCLPGSALWLEVSVFVEKRLLRPIELPEHGPIDLTSQQRLWVEVTPPGQRRPLELANRHAILVQDAQFEFIDDGAVRRARLVDRQTKIPARCRSPPETVAVAVASRDAANLAKPFAVVGKMHREHGSVSLAPFDQGSERISDIAEIDRDALPHRHPDRGMPERRDAALFDYRRRVAGAIKIDFDNLRAPLRSGLAASPAHHTGGDWRECKDVLSAFPVASGAQMRPGLAIHRGLKAIGRRRLLAPIHFQSGEGRGLAKVDLQPRLLG